MKKINFIVSIFFVMPIFATYEENYKIVRISSESLQQTIEKEKFDAQCRMMQKVATVAAVAVTVYGLVYYSHYFNAPEITVKDGQEISLHKDWALVKRGAWVPKVEVNSSTNLSWSIENMPSIFKKSMYDAGKNVVDTSLGVARWVTDSAASFIGMGLLTLGSQQASNYWSYFHETEELLGFIKHQTKLWKYTSIMKEFSIPFDVYSQRLSTDVNFGVQRLMLSDFMKDMIDAASTSNEWAQQKLFMTMKKDYLQKTAMLQELQDYALQSMSFRQQIESDLVHNSLEVETFNRVSIAEFCNLLILEIERVIAFIEMKTEDSFMKNYFAQGSQALLKATNIFSEKVEAQLALSMLELHEKSKVGDGLFDMIFDFNVFLEQHFDAMHVRLQYQV